MQSKLAEEVMPGMFSVDAAARYLGYSRTSIFAMLRDGELRSIVYKRRRHIPKAECDRWIEKMLSDQNDEAA